MFGHKCKYNRGPVSKGAWVFGMVERGSGRALTFLVPERTRETLVKRLIQDFVEPGTVIISDKFSPLFQPKHPWLHPSDGQPLGKLCRPVQRSPYKHHSRTLGSGEEKAEKYVRHL